MIAFLEGRLVEKHPTHVIVDVQGVGYHVNISLSSYESLSVEDGRVNILTHLYVREDAMTLYGFASVSERDLFERLIAVSGIGPPMALKILSGIPIADFRRLVAAEDAKGLTRIKGIGQKTRAASGAGDEGQNWRYCARRFYFRCRGACRSRFIRRSRCCSVGLGRESSAGTQSCCDCFA